jgi:hypothetical protein
MSVSVASVLAPDPGVRIFIGSRGVLRPVEGRNEQVSQGLALVNLLDHLPVLAAENTFSSSPVTSSGK